MANLQNIEPEQWPEIRGLALRYIYRQERKRAEVVFQRIWAFVRDDGYKASLDDVQTILEDLRDAGLCTFRVDENVKTGAERTVQIKLTGKGKSLVERTVDDPLVKVGVSRDE